MSWRSIHGNVGESPKEKCVSADLMHLIIPCSFCDSKINIYIYRLSSLWIYYYFEYVDCNIWFIVHFRLAKLHSFNAHIWKLLSQKSLFIDKCENDIHAHVYYQFDTYVAEFHIVSWRQMMPRGIP
jgi:hypothetical protein